jgi:hypothetical protein
LLKLLKIVILMPITARPKVHKVDGAAKSSGAVAAAETIVGNPFEFVAEDNVKKTLSPVIRKAKKKAGSRKKLAKGQTCVTSADGKDKVVKGSRKKIKGEGDAEAEASADGKDKVVKGSRKKIKGEGDAEAEVKLVGKTDEKVAVTADAEAEAKGAVEEVSEVTTDAEAETKLVGKMDKKVAVTADAEAEMKGAVEEVSEVTTDSKAEMKLVGKTDEKVAVTADAESETNLPVEEVAEVTTDAEAKTKLVGKTDEKVAVTADAEAETKLSVEEVAEVSTKLVGKMDEKVVVTADAEAEMKLPVEEVAKVEMILVGKTDEKVVVTVEAEAETKLPVEEVVEAVEEMDEEVAEQLEKKEPVLVVYPFVASDLIEAASRGLSLGEHHVQWSRNCILQEQQSNAHDKARCTSVTQHDMDSVQPGVYATDVIIDFRSAWIMMHEVMKESYVLPMTTYFYSSLIKNGLQEVMRWFQKVDVFEKKKCSNT